MTDPFDEIIENYEVIFDFLKSTKIIRGYTVESDLTFHIGREGDCCFIAMFPTNDCLDDSGNVVPATESEFLTTHDMRASELASAIKDLSLIHI